MSKQDFLKHHQACSRWLTTRPEVDRKIRILLASGVVSSSDELSRPVVVTAFGGHYEQPAGYTIAMNGSPVKAVIVTSPYGHSIIWRGNYLRTLKPLEEALVNAYLESLHVPASVTNSPYPFTMYVDGELVTGSTFHVKPWFWRDPDLYRQLFEPT